MLSGRNNFYFMRASELPLMTAYCLVMALILSCLSIQDWLKNHNMEAATELLMSLLFGVYASYLSLADRTWNAVWPERLVVILLALMGLWQLAAGVNVLAMLYWVPFYLAFSLGWRRAWRLLIAIAVVVPMILWLHPEGPDPQAVVTWMVGIVMALMYSWLNCRSDLALRDNLGADPVTSAYQQAQLLYDLRREVPRADRHNTRLMLALINQPTSWLGQNDKERRQLSVMLGSRLAEAMLPHQSLYLLESGNFVVLMPHARQTDIDALSAALPYCLMLDEVQAALCFTVLSYRADDDATSLFERLLATDSEEAETVR